MKAWCLNNYDVKACCLDIYVRLCARIFTMIGLCLDIYDVQLDAGIIMM